MKIELLKIEDLIPYHNNPRVNDPAVDYVASSISEFGFKVPIVIDKDNVIVAGHTRLKAAIKLKLKELPCIRATDLTDAQIKAFRIADNKTNEFAEWDFAKLDIELEELEDFDYDFGFDEKGKSMGNEEPEIEFSEELLEEHNFIVLYFDNSIDWLQAETLFDIKTKTEKREQKSMQSSGIGRVLNGALALNKIIKNED